MNSDSIDQEDTVTRAAEKNAYEAMMRAFMCQSHEISLEKQTLLEELRTELQISDDEHRVILDKLINDDNVKRIRKLRKEKIDSGCSHQLSGESTPESATLREREPKIRSVNELVYGIKAADLGRVWRVGYGRQGHNDSDDDDPKDSDYDPKSDK